jgi:hypothetical protein
MPAAKWVPTAYRREPESVTTDEAYWPMEAFWLLRREKRLYALKMRRLPRIGTLGNLGGRGGVAVKSQQVV